MPDTNCPPHRNNKQSYTLTKCPPHRNVYLTKESQQKRLKPPCMVKIQLNFMHYHQLFLNGHLFKTDSSENRLFKMDITLRRALSASPKGVHFRENWINVCCTLYPGLKGKGRITTNSWITCTAQVFGGTRFEWMTCFHHMIEEMHLVVY